MPLSTNTFSCAKRPAFVVEGRDTAAYCRQDAEDSMANVHKRCPHAARTRQVRARQHLVPSACHANEISTPSSSNPNPGSGCRRGL